MTADPVALSPADRQRAVLAELDRLELIVHGGVEYLLAGGSNGVEKNGPSTPATRYIFTWTPARTRPIIAALRATFERHAPTRDHGRFSRAGEGCPPAPYGIGCGCDLRALICGSCRDDAGDPIPWEDCLEWAGAAAAIGAVA